MKVCLIQPLFSMYPEDAEKLSRAILADLDQCDDSMDLIVLPESCDALVRVTTRQELEAVSNPYREILLKKASDTARRCHALVCLNLHGEVNGQLRNATYLFDRDGNEAARYDKQHLVPTEKGAYGLEHGYCDTWSSPYIVELEGVRYAFLTCYDLYFYEMFSNLARFAPDVILCCTQQRSDTHAASEIMARFLAYQTNAYVFRASVSMGEDSPIGGTTMAVAPDGEVLCNLMSRVAMETVEIDPHKKYLKPAGFGNPPAPHWQYIDAGRRPWKYRPAGSAVSLPEAELPYPRVCAHRGFSSIAPENSLPAFGAAVALGAEEIELDLHSTLDGEIVSIHDANLERVSDGTGFVREHTLSELKALDFGSVHGKAFAGLRILSFEEILQKLSCHVILNIHLKQFEGTPVDNEAVNEAELVKILDLIDRYDCRKYVYFMSCQTGVHKALARLAPDIPRCMGDGDHSYTLVDRAIRLGCQKVQLFKPYFTQEMIDKARAHGIRVNLFWSDDPDETRDYLARGIDTVLSNDYWQVARAIKGK